MAGANAVVRLGKALDSEIQKKQDTAWVIKYLYELGAQKAKQSMSESKAIAKAKPLDLPPFCKEKLSECEPACRPIDAQWFVINYPLEKEPDCFFTIANNGHAPTAGEAKTLKFFDLTQALPMTIVEQGYREPVVHGNTIQLIECQNGTWVTDDWLTMYDLSGDYRVVVRNADELMVQVVSNQYSALASPQR